MSKINKHEYVDDHEMEEIRKNQQLNRSLKHALKDMRSENQRTLPPITAGLSGMIKPKSSKNGKDLI